MSTTINSLVALMQVQFVQISLLILLVGGITCWLKNRNPHLVFALWAVVFVKCLTPPVMVTPVGLFAWQTSPATQAAAGFSDAPAIGKSVADETVSPPEPVRQSAGVCENTESATANHPPLVDNQLPESERSNAVAATDQRDDLPTSLRDPARSELPAATPAPLTRTGTATPAVQPGWPVLLTLIWLAGMAIILSVVAMQWIRCWLVLKRSRVAVNRQLVSVVEQVKTKLGFRRPVRLIVNRAGYGPMVFGYLRPTLVLPHDIVKNSSREQLQPIVAHELIHVRRGDTFLGQLQFVAQTIWWFNPLVWWASRQTNRVCEQCCDLEVVDALQCKPVAYARTLLNIVELRYSLRGLTASAGIRPAEVTASRLRWLARQGASLGRRPTWVCWLVATLAALLVFPASGLTGPQELPGKDRPPVTRSSFPEKELYDGNLAFARQDWDEASNLYQAYLKKKPNVGTVWFRLGYALHAQGKLEEAIVAHKKASTFRGPHKTALYNWACALCLQGETEAALKKLAEALDAGFALPRPLAEDTDFASIRDDERFIQLAQKHARLVKAAGYTFPSPPGVIPVDGSEPVADPEIYSQLDFWTGEWQLENAAGERIGTSVVSRRKDGHLIREDWNRQDGSSGHCISHYDPSTQTWKQHRTGADGSIINLSGTVSNNTVLEMSGTVTLKNGRQAKYRMKCEKLDDQRLKQEVFISKDHGESWENRFEGFYTRKK